MSKISQDQYLALMGYSDDSDYEDFELAPGKVIKYRAATPAEYLKFQIRRNPAERQSYVGGIRIGQDMAKREAKAKADGVAFKPGEPDFDMVPFVETRIDSAPEGMASYICMCTDQGGNETLERRWIAHPRMPAFHAACKLKTEGATPEEQAAFFDAVSDIALGRTPTSERPDASSNSGSEPSEASPSPTPAAA